VSIPRSPADQPEVISERLRGVLNNRSMLRSEAAVSRGCASAPIAPINRVFRDLIRARILMHARSNYAAINDSAAAAAAAAVAGN